MEVEMAYSAASGFVHRANSQRNRGARSQYVLSFLFPGGCQMGCDYCIIGQRGEQQLPVRLNAQDYVSIMQDFHASGELHSAFAAGEEVLLNRFVVEKYLLPVLEEAKRLGILGGFITNGLNLAKFAEQIAAVGVDWVVVSLDGVGGKNAHRCYKNGTNTYDDVVASLRKACTIIDPKKMSLAMVLRENNADALYGLTDLANELGIHQITITP